MIIHEVLPPAGTCVRIVAGPWAGRDGTVVYSADRRIRQPGKRLRVLLPDGKRAVVRPQDITRIADIAYENRSRAHE